MKNKIRTIRPKHAPVPKHIQEALNRQIAELYPDAEKKLLAEIEAAKRAAEDRALKEHTQKDD